MAQLVPPEPDLAKRPRGGLSADTNAAPSPERTLMPTYLSAFAHRLGAPVAITDCAEVDPSEVVRLAAQGMGTVRIADRGLAQMANEAISSTLEVADRGVLEVDQVIYATSTSWSPTDVHESPTTWRCALGLEDVPFVAVGMNACANFGSALKLATGLIAAGESSTILLATADLTLPGNRVAPGGYSVLSDGAASCLVSRTRPSHGYELLGIAEAFDANLDLLDSRLDGIAIAKATLRAISSATARLLGRTGLTEADIARFVTNNYVERSLRFLSLATQMPYEKLYRENIAAVGHCAAADAVIDLQALLDQGTVSSGDIVLVLLSGPSSWFAAAVRAVGPDGVDQEHSHGEAKP